MSITVRAVVDAIEGSFPSAWAEGWDRVGLLAGDPDAAVTGVLVSLDPTLEAIDRARSGGCNVLATHHPAYLDPVPAPRAGAGPAGVLHAAGAAGIALIAAHTNLDRAPQGAASLPLALGYPAGEPLESSLQPVDLVVTYVVPASVDSVRIAAHAAGAGRIGQYSGCSFSSEGLGRFRPLENTTPEVGTPGEDVLTPEQRLELIAPSGAGAAVAEAIASTHPYEEPLILVLPGHIARGAARLGRKVELEEPSSLMQVAARVVEQLGCTPRVWGDPETPVQRLGFATGSGGSLIGEALSSGLDALIAGEVRYHDALNATAAGLAIIEAGHDVTEWPLVEVLADAIRSLPGLPAHLVHVDAPARGWWTP